MVHPHEDTVNRTSQPPVICFALGIIGLGVIAIVTGDFAEMGQTVAAWVPGRTALAYASGIVMVLGGIALMLNQTRALSVRVLLPFAILSYFLAYIDRINGSFAALTMRGDLDLSATVYGFAVGTFYWGYFIFEVPSNIIMEKVGARIWIARMVTRKVSEMCGSSPLAPHRKYCARLVVNYSVRT